jgi:hypothetical protein
LVFGLIYEMKELLDLFPRREIENLFSVQI